MTADGSPSFSRILLTIFLALSTITCLICVRSERSGKSQCLPLFRSEEKQTAPSPPQDWSDWFSSFWLEEPESPPPPPPSKLKRTISSSSFSRHSDAKSTQTEAISKRKGRNKKHEHTQRGGGEPQDHNFRLGSISSIVPFGQEQQSHSSRDKRNIKNRLSFDRDDSSIISRKRRRRHDSTLEPSQRPSSRQGILMKIAKAKPEEPKAESWSEALAAFNMFGNDCDQRRTEESSNTSIVKRKIIKAKPEQPKTESWGEALMVFNVFSNEHEQRHKDKILKRKMTGAIPKVLVITEKKKSEKKSQQLASEGGIHQIIGQIVPFNWNDRNETMFGSFSHWLEDKSGGVYSSSSSSYEDDEESLFSNLSFGSQSTNSRRRYWSGDDSNASVFSIESITWD